MYVRFMVFLKHFGYPLVLICCGLAAVLESIRITSEYRIPKWISGPSGYVMIIGTLLMVIGTVEAYLAYKNKKKHGDTETVASKAESSSDEREEFNVRRLWSAILLLFLYIILIPYLGFTISSFLFIIFILRMLKNSIKVTIISSVVILLILIFGLPELGLVLPRGVLGF